MRSLMICTPHLILSRRMKWVGHVAGMGREEVRIWLWWGKVIERDHLENPGVSGRIICGNKMPTRCNR
jgi:hypothetical protein